MPATEYDGIRRGSSMMAQLALIAADTISRAGSIPAASAACASIDINKMVVAVLLVASIRKVTINTMMAIITSGC